MQRTMALLATVATFVVLSLGSSTPCQHCSVKAPFPGRTIRSGRYRIGTLLRGGNPLLLKSWEMAPLGSALSWDSHASSGADLAGRSAARAVRAGEAAASTSAALAEALRSGSPLSEVEALLDSLLKSTEGGTVDISKLGGFGFGRVAYTRGPQAWRLWQGALGLRGAVPKGRSGQLFTGDKRVVNYAETVGLDVTAFGTWQLDPGVATTYPFRLTAQVEGGAIDGNSWRLPLPFIRGTGQFEVLYADASCRVFRSGLALVVQLPDETPRAVADALQRLEQQDKLD